MIDDAAEAGNEPTPFLVTAQAILERVQELFGLGGPVAAVLFMMSVVALTIVGAKLWQLGAVRVGNRRAARRALQLYRAGRWREALAVGDASANPAAAALTRAIRGQQKALPEATVREEVMRYGAEALESLRSGFRALEIIASLAPLLGLFGTVLGMIEAFQAMEQAGNQVNPAVLSGGIWEALLTTALGLGVAMPVVVVLGWLERRVDRLAHEMDHVVSGVFTVDLSRDTEQEYRFGVAPLGAGATAAGD